MTIRAVVAIATMTFTPMYSLAAQALVSGPSSLQSPSAVAAAPRHAIRNFQDICDGSELRSARHQAQFGVGLMAASLPVALIGMYRTAHSSNHPQAPVAIGVSAGAGLALLGFAVAASSQPHESFWESAIARMQPGDTRTEEVRTCLARPVAQATTDTTEEWTYLTSRGLTGRVKTVRLTFRDSVLIGIRRAEVDANLFHDRHNAILPAATVFPDPR